jgi:cytochrome c-type biogenesis protein CcmH/NrfG
MANESTTQPTGGSAWQVKQVYAMAVISLVVGLAIGYLFRGSQSPAPPAQPVATAQPSPAAGAMGGMGGPTPTLDQMKQMADKKAEPVLEKLKSDPNNSDLLIEVGNIYKSTHQFKAAAVYYGKALQVDPKNVAIRTEMASCMYYDGDVNCSSRCTITPRMPIRCSTSG